MGIMGSKPRVPNISIPWLHIGEALLLRMPHPSGLPYTFLICFFPSWVVVVLGGLLFSPGVFNFPSLFPFLKIKVSFPAYPELRNKEKNKRKRGGS
jgi:hypothetical protein